jgi:hypothetical protein
MTGCNVQFSPEIHSGSCVERRYTWEDICNKVRNPCVITKDGIEPELWSFYIMKGQRGEYGRLKANQTNVDKVMALQVDFDNGRTIKDFISKFSDIKFVLYTSKSHTKHHNKFRVIIPLKHMISNDVFSDKSNKDYLKDLFKGCDKSTFDAWRKQRIPFITPATEEYIWHVNKGRLFELDIELMNENWRNARDKYEFGRHIIPMNIDLEIDPFKTTFEEMRQISILNALINRYRDELSSLPWHNRGTGIVHETCRRVYWSLMHHGMDRYDIYSLIMEYSPHKYIEEMKQLCFGGL